MTTPIEMVREFHTAFNHPILVGPARVVVERANLRFNLIEEEVNEFADAETDADRLDALGDIVYVVCGAALEFGLAGREAFQTTPADSGCYQPDNHLYFGGDAFDMRRQVALLAEGIDNHSVASVGAALCNLYQICLDVADGANLPLAAALAEIHRSNMAKLGPDGRPIYRDDGKVMKPEGWTPPNIGGLLA